MNNCFFASFVVGDALLGVLCHLCALCKLASEIYPQTSTMAQKGKESELERMFPLHWCVWHNNLRTLNAHLESKEVRKCVHWAL